MRVLAAQERHVVHALQLDVVEEAAEALDQRDGLVGQNRRAHRALIDEALIRHHANSLRATASTASTMA